MCYARLISRPLLLLAALASAVMVAPRPGAAQLGLSVPTTDFELADNIQLDRADSAVLAQLERVKAYLADRQWDEAIETLRQLMESAEGKLISVDWARRTARTPQAETPKDHPAEPPERFVSLGDYCQLQLASLPPEALKLYRGRIDPLAKQWYDDGIARRDRRLLACVVQQAFASSWGDKALLALGELALESGDYTTARWNWQRILPAQPPPGVPNNWPGYPDTKLDVAAVRARLVLVSILEGSADRAREELSQFVKLHPDARGRLGGREVNYAAALAELLTQSDAWPQPKPALDWLTFAGTPQRNGIASELVDVGTIAWRSPLPRLAPPLGPAELPNPGIAESAKTRLSFHPVLVGERLFVGDQQEIHGLRLKDGKPVWGDSAAIYRDQTEGPLTGLRNPMETVGVARYTMTVAEGRLYARMGSAVTGRPQQETSAFSPGCLVCLDLQAEGRLLWKIAPEEGWAFEGAPIVDGACVYVGMRRSDIRSQAHVACFDAQTGRLRWRRFVCGAETPARGMYHQSTHNLLAMEGRTLYYNTNLGAVAAISADDGRLLWVSLYPRQRKGDLTHLPPHWQRDLNPCLVHQGMLLAAPADSPHIFAFDACTGQILWRTGPDSDVEDSVHLLGVAGDCLIASGQKLYWISLKADGRGRVRVKHAWPDGPEKPGYGRGVLAGGGVLWPTRQKIYLFDQNTARPKKTIDLAPLGITGGNLLAAGRMLLIATSTELIALGRGEKKDTPGELTESPSFPPGTMPDTMPRMVGSAWERTPGRSASSLLRPGGMAAAHSDARRGASDLQRSHAARGDEE